MNPDNKPLDSAAMIFVVLSPTIPIVPSRSSTQKFFASPRLGRSVGVLTACVIFRVDSQPVKFRKLKLYLKNCLFPFCVKFFPSLLFALLANCMASLAPKVSFLSSGSSRPVLLYFL